jgi:hypothetical protein
VDPFVPAGAVVVATLSGTVVVTKPGMVVGSEGSVVDVVVVDGVVVVVDVVVVEQLALCELEGGI